MKKTKLVSLSGMCGALTVVLLYIGSLAGYLDLTSAAAASFITIFAVIELGGVFPFLIYATSAFISVLILPQKSAAVVYMLFAGFYPILKSRFEGLGKKRRSWVLKIIAFNICFTAIVLSFKYISGLSENSDYELWLLPVIYVLSNLVFIIYDILLTRIIWYYLRHLSPKIRKYLR